MVWLSMKKCPMIDTYFSIICWRCSCGIQCLNMIIIRIIMIVINLTLCLNLIQNFKVNYIQLFQKFNWKQTCLGLCLCWSCLLELLPSECWDIGRWNILWSNFLFMSVKPRLNLLDMTEYNMGFKAELK